MTRSRLQLCSELTLLVALLVAVGSARADDGAGAGPDATVAEYERHVELGTELFGAGDFAAARREFRAAHAIHPEPTLLFNIASTHRREGDDAAALSAYRRFLVDAPADHQHRALAQRTIAELEAAAATTSGQDEDDSDVDDEFFYGDEGIADEGDGASEGEAIADGADSEVAVAELDIEAAPVGAVEASASRPGRTLRIAGISTAAVGGVALAFGVISGRRAASREAELEDQPAGGWSPSLQAIYDEGQAHERRAVVFGLVGAGALAVGGTLYWLGRKHGEEARLAVVPGRGEAQLVWLGRF